MYCVHLFLMIVLRWRDINCVILLVDDGSSSANNNSVRWWQLRRYVFILLAYIRRCSWNVATTLRDLFGCPYMCFMDYG